jgi:hypothetical protein
MARIMPAMLGVPRDSRVPTPDSRLPTAPVVGPLYTAMGAGCGAAAVAVALSMTADIL